MFTAHIGADVSEFEPVRAGHGDLRTGPISFQSRCRTRRPNLVLVFKCLFCVIVCFGLLAHVCFCCVQFFQFDAYRLAGKNVSEMTYFGSSGTLKLNSLWSPYVIGQTIIFSSCFFLSFFFFFSSPNLSSRRLDVYHTSVHGVVLV